MGVTNVEWSQKAGHISRRKNIQGKIPENTDSNDFIHSLSHGAVLGQNVVINIPFKL